MQGIVRWDSAQGVVLQGIVRWYSSQGFGFIDPADSTDGKAFYFHISDVKGRAILKPGDRVTFSTFRLQEAQSA